jgi:hypothetical protein
MNLEDLKEMAQLVLGLLTVAGGLVLLWFKPDIKTEAMALLMLVLGYYFGSSPGSVSRQTSALKTLIGGKADEKETVPGSVPGANVSG